MIIDAKISGDAFLNLKEDSLEQYGLSTEFQIPLLKIVEEVVCNIDAYSCFNMYYACIAERVPKITKIKDTFTTIQAKSY